MLRRSIITLLLLTSSTFAAKPEAERLASDCDALLQDAIHRPYGWGWTSDAVGESLGKPVPRVISMEPMATPAAGVMLLWAGKFLHEQRFIDAAAQVARGVSISQKSTGRINSNVIFSRAPIVNEERSAVPDRSATRCALGLMLALQKENASADNEAVHRTASRCTNWLFHQLTPNNYWPTAFPPDATPQQAIRIIRLDDGDYRDSSIALLLADAIIPDDTLDRTAANPTNSLLKIILKNDVHGPNLWNTAVSSDALGVPTNFPRGPDVLASRFVMQTLLAGYLLTGDKADGMALDAAAATLAQSKRPDGQYDRFLDPVAAADITRQFGDSPAAATTQTVFAQPTTKPASAVISFPFTTGDFGVPSVVDATKRLKETGRTRYLAMMSAEFTLHQQLIAMLCGLDDDPMTLTMPVSADEVPGYLKSHAEQLRATEGSDLSGRVRNLWRQLVKAKVEGLSIAAG